MTSQIMRVGAGSFGGVPAGPTGAMPVPGSLRPGLPASFQGEAVGAAQAVAQHFNFGQAPSIQNGQMDLETTPIPYTYLCPPGGDDADMRYAMPDMPAFSINHFDPDEGSTTVVTLAKLNQYMHEAYKDFEEASEPNSPDSFQDAIDFRRYLETLGERALETFHQARKHPNFMKKLEDAPSFTDLEHFYRLSTQDMFCWLTKFGILSKINYLGPILTVNRDVTLEAENNTLGMDHYTVLNVALAKRCSIANIFGDADAVTTGTVLWLKLVRKEVSVRGKVEFQEFYIVPEGNKLWSHPSMASLSYTDPSGRAMFGHRFCVGKVLTPGKRSPNPVAMQNTANIGIYVNEKMAYEDHGTLPVLQIAAGFK